MKHKHLLVLGGIVGSASLLVAIAICPVALAENQSAIGVKISPRLSVANTKPTININYSSTQNFIHTDFTTINVSTNNKTGYTLVMSDQDENTDLTSTKPTSTAKIPSLTGPISTVPPVHGNFPSLGWGFSTNASTSNPLNNQIDFLPIPKSSAPSNIRQTTGPTSNDQTNVTFGVKVNNSLASGTYQDTVTFSVVTNYVNNTIFDISSMQEMTPAICTNTTQPTKDATETISEHSTDTSKVPETTLTDTRDGKTYVVRKLADGNCWMSQNLALSPDGNTTYTEADTDLHDGRTFKAPAASSVGTTWDWDGSDGPHYVKPQAGYEYFQNGTTASSTGQPTESAGNYYDWPMTTAMSGQSLTGNGDEAPDSICPKGWRLPSKEGNKSYYNLLFTNYSLSNNSESTTKLLLLPLSFIRAGYYGLDAGSFINSGSGSSLWSSTVYGSDDTYVLDFGGSYVYPQDYSSRGLGHSVRCVAN